MGLLGSMRANLARAKKRVRSGYSYVKQSLFKESKPKAPTDAERAAMPADGNVDQIRQRFPDTDGSVITEIRRRMEIKTHPDGTTVHSMDESVVQMQAADPKSVAPTTEFMGEQPKNATASELIDAVKKSSSKSGMLMKIMAVKSFIIVGLAMGGLAYFLTSAKERQECINRVFERYPMFSSQGNLEQHMARMGGKCTTDTSELCENINGAVAMLDACDNTLLRNILGEMFNIAGDGIDWTFDQVKKGAGFVGDVFSDMIWPVLWPILIAVGAVALIALGFFLLRKRRAAPAFGRGARCTGRRGSLRLRCA
jgi:hypothetical protein